MLISSPARKPGTVFGLLVYVLALLGVVYAFFVGLELISGSCRALPGGFADGLQQTTANPLVGLFTGILAASLVQSSSTITSLTVALVAGGALPLAAAVPVVLGANIGTTVANTIASMGHVSRPDEFRRAMAGATVHDFFNWIAVVVLLPLELLFGVLSKPAGALTSGVADLGGTELLAPLREITRPAAALITESLFDSGVLALLVGLALLLLALRYVVVLLKLLVMGRLEGLVDRCLGGRPVLAMAIGVLLTVLVQSSSVTTSLIVPLVGAGILTVRQIFPYTLGANIGTTITALLAALVLAGGATGGEVELARAGLTIAFVHLLFNVFGVLIVYPFRPLRELPVRMAEFIGELAYRSRVYAVLYLLGLFYGLPLAIELFRGLFRF